jgi:hypothetical protein
MLQIRTNQITTSRQHAAETHSDAREFRARNNTWTENRFKVQLFKT